MVKRLADDGGSSSDEDKRPKKLAKILLPIKATDLLAAPLNNPATKNKKLNPLVKLKTALIKPNNSASSSSTIAQSTTAPSTSSTAPSAPAPIVKPSLGGLGLLGSYSDSSSHSDSDNWFVSSIQPPWLHYKRMWRLYIHDFCFKYTRALQPQDSATSQSVAVDELLNGRDFDSIQMCRDNGICSDAIRSVLPLTFNWSLYLPQVRFYLLLLVHWIFV